MRAKRITVLAVTFIFLLTASASFAAWRGWRGSGGWGMGSQYNRMYNPDTVETLSGTV